jgi:hypothetical protein
MIAGLPPVAACGMACMAGMTLLAVGCSVKMKSRTRYFEPDARPGELIAEIARQRPAGSK